MNKHTPGPWTAHFEEAYFVTGIDGGRVAMITHLKGPYGVGGRRSAEETAANCRLMASAPDLLKQRDGLLAELKATEGRLHEVSTFCATVEQQRDELLNILQRLKAVDFGEHWNSDAEQAAIAARALITKFEVENVL